MSEVVAVLGSGEPMGSAITRNLVRSGLTVRAWNGARDNAEADGPAGNGVHFASTPVDAVRGAGIVLTMLPDADAVIGAMEDALPGIDSSADPHVIWLQMSAIGEGGTQRCIYLANQNGIGFVDAPVLGSRESAEAGTLVILESGPEEGRPRVQPVFDAIGERTIRAGEAGAGTRMKAKLKD